MERIRQGAKALQNSSPPTDRLHPPLSGVGRATGRFNEDLMRRWTTIACLFGITGSLWSGTGESSKRNLPQLLTPRRMTRRMPLAEGNDIQFRRLGASLSQTRVGQIVQDREGFIWFGTQDGLNRYDGYELKVFRHDPDRGDSLSGVAIFSLLEDRIGSLWVGSDEFLDRFDPVSEKFTQYEFSPEVGSAPTHIYCSTQDASGLIWLCTRDGLYQIDPVAHQNKLFRHDPGDSSTLASNVIVSSGEDGKGNFWVGTTAGLDLFDRKSQKVISHLPLAGSEAQMCFHEDRLGTFWIIYGTDGQLAVFDKQTNTLSKWEPIAERDGATSRILFSTMLEDRDGQMWFGTLNNGLLKFDREQQRFIRYMARPSDPDGLSDRRVTALYQDREGLIWAGFHQAKPNYFLPRAPTFQRIRFADQDSSMISTILEDNSGNLWLGLDRGMRRLDRKRGLNKDVAPLSADETTSMVESSPSIFWIGTAGHGLKRYDEKSGRLTSYLHDPSNHSSLPSNFVERVAQDSTGSVWAVTWAGLARWNPLTNDFTAYMPEHAPNGLNLHTVLFGRNGLIWIGTNLGLYRFSLSSNQFTLFGYDRHNPTSLSNDRVNSIHEAADGSLWVGTQNGLDKLDPNGVILAHFTERNGLAGNTVSCILEDRAHELWISTNRGLSRLDTATRSFKTYGAEDGLPGPDLTGWGGCSQSKSGEMFFAGFSGATAFFPQKVTDPTYAPPVVFTNFRLYDASSQVEGKTHSVININYSRNLKLLSSQNKFSIEFSALSFLSPASNRLRYRMQDQGRQGEWTEVSSNQRSATYMALPAGSYVFEVQGATRHGPWSTSGATLNIMLLAPWWKSLWFRLCVIFVTGFVLLIAHRLRVQHLAHTYNLRLEGRVSERVRIARELHDTLLQGFQGITLRMQGVARNMPVQDPIRKMMEEVLGRADEVLREARHRVRHLRQRTTNGNELPDRLTKCGQELSKDHAATFTLAIIGEPKVLESTVQDEASRIAGEALTNAFRHASASKIETEVTFDSSALRIRVRDDGAGIDKAVMANGHPDHWGLTGMRERARAIRAELNIWSRKAAGTEVELVIPASIAYPRE
jgi:ligand-binding sensor domain-containing protein/signal transduction histidine kinase